jgi:hydroxymethylpyrimidine/phosphomethylpyrimidine kinase
MLLNAEIVLAVAGFIQSSGIPAVIDPVMVATSGATLLAPDAVAAVRTKLIPLAALVTPNLDEATILLGRKSAGGLEEALEPRQDLRRAVPAQGRACSGRRPPPTASPGRPARPRPSTPDAPRTWTPMVAAAPLRRPSPPSSAKGKSLSEAVTIAHAYLQGAIQWADQGRGVELCQASLS